MTSIFDAVVEARAKDTLPIFTVYEYPSDFPDLVVVRMSLVHQAPATAGQTRHVWKFETVDDARRVLERCSLFVLDRHPTDCISIVETWV